MPATLETVGRAFDKYARLWVSKVRPSVRNWQDAEDVVGDGVAVAMANVKKCDEDTVDGVGAWVYGFIKNAIREYRDKRRRPAKERKVGYIADLTPTQLNALKIEAQADDGFALRFALLRASSYDRQVVNMIIEGYTLREIAECYGVKFQTVHARLSKLVASTRKAAA